MSKILITGAAGFIGSQLAHYLWKNEDDIVLLDNFSYGNEDNLVFDDADFRSRILHLDVRDKVNIENLFREEKFDVCYHIAAITPLPDCQMNPALAVEVNVAGTVNILEAARKYGCKKIIFASTSAVYENDNEFPSREKREEFPSLLYPNTKFTAERYCEAYCDVYGMNITALRFANVYGPHMDCLRTQPPIVAYLIREYLNGRSPILHSDGKQQRDFVFVDDLLRLAILVQKGTGFDIVNVSSNSTISIGELANKVKELMGIKGCEPKYVDSDLYWRNYPDLYKGCFAISNEALAHEVNKYTLLDNRHAVNDYGWKIENNIETGLKKTIDFTVNALRNHYGL